MSNSQRQDNSEQEATGSYSYPYSMDQSGQQQSIAMGVVPAQIAYAPGAYPAAQMVASGAAPVPAPGQPTSSYPATPAMGGQHQLTYQQVPHFHNNQQIQQQQEQLQKFWATQLQEADQATDFRNHNLPLARIKKIMKADEDVKMISAEAPVVFAKACEMFILELTLRSWFHTEENRRRTLQKNDIAAAITRTDIFDFLVDIVPRDELKEEGLAIAGAALPTAGGPAESVPYYYLPQHGAPGMIMGQPVDQAAAAMYVAQQPHPMTYMAWQQPPAQAQPRQDQPNQQQGSAAAPDP